jgi:hypothetical protein
MKQSITLVLPLSEIIDEWFANRYGAEVSWTQLTLVDHRDYETLEVFLDEGYRDIKSTTDISSLVFDLGDSEVFDEDEDL